jgi:hypothetical protein
MSGDLVEDRIVLHDLRGVNVKVDFFLGTRQDLKKDTKCISYSVCWESVNIRVYQITLTEEVSDLDFYQVTQQLMIDDHIIVGEVINFKSEKVNDIIIASCTVLLGRDY